MFAEKNQLQTGNEGIEKMDDNKSHFEFLLHSLCEASDHPDSQITIIGQAYEEHAETLALVLVAIMGGESGVKPSVSGSSNILHPKTLAFLKEKFPAEDKHQVTSAGVRTDVKNTLS